MRASGTGGRVAAEGGRRVADTAAAGRLWRVCCEDIKHSRPCRGGVMGEGEEGAAAAGPVGECECKRREGGRGVCGEEAREQGGVRWVVGGWWLHHQLSQRQILNRGRGRDQIHAFQSGLGPGQPGTATATVARSLALWRPQSPVRLKASSWVMHSD
jgi:hypothetical protein